MIFSNIKFIPWANGTTAIIDSSQYHLSFKPSFKAAVLGRGEVLAVLWWSPLVVETEEKVSFSSPVTSTPLSPSDPLRPSFNWRSSISLWSVRVHVHFVYKQTHYTACIPRLTSVTWVLSVVTSSSASLTSVWSTVVLPSWRPSETVISSREFSRTIVSLPFAMYTNWVPKSKLRCT